MTEPFKLYKLIILYMLDKVDFPMTTSQLSEFILDKGYTTYFKFKQALTELTDSDLVWEENTYNRTLYNLSETGEEAISLLKKDISPAITADIDRFISEKRYDLKSEVSVKADFYQSTAFEYTVRCQVIEKGNPLIELNLSVPSKAEAEKVANNWTEKNEELYTIIMEKLLS